jgi:TRAP-type uncharacterized transport system substrate-binding protein
MLLGARIGRISWRDLAFTLGPFVAVCVAAIWVALHFVQPAPPHSIIITSGAEGTGFHRIAERYRDILARNGVELKILPSEGAVQNLARLADPKFRVDIGLVQGGLAKGTDIANLSSLGSMFYEPLLVFYRDAKPIQTLAGLAGKRIAIGAEGSGTHALALSLLSANGITAPGPTRLLPLGGEDAARAFVAGEIDAGFLAGDSASGDNMRALLHAPGARLMNFVQAEAYVRRFPYLSELNLPAGAFDLGQNIPAKPVSLIAPTVELIARGGLHPALSDLLIEAAREVHGGAALFRKAGEFPVPLEHEFPISDSAARYYKSGKEFLYRQLPFWLASLLDRTVVLLIPVAVLVLPGLRIVPVMYRWRIQSRIYKRYGELMALERETLEPLTAERQAELQEQLASIEKTVIGVRIPGAFAGQLYVLREHIGFVRERLGQHAAKP